MVKSKFQIDYVNGRVVTFATKERATLVLTQEGEFMTPTGAFPLRALGAGGFILLYETPVPFDFVSVKFSTVHDGKGRECPDWSATLFRGYRDISSTSFDASVREIFPYLLPFVAVNKAISNGSVDELMYVIKTYRSYFIEEGVLEVG